MALVCLVVGLAATAVFAGAATASARGCCVGSAPTYTYDASTKKLTITFSTPANSQPNSIAIRSSCTLGPDGVITGTLLGAPGVGIVSPFTYPWDPASGFPTVFCFQVVFSCFLQPETSCPGGSSIVLAPPVKVDITAAEAQKPTPVTAELGKVPPSNGTKACDSARARIKYVNGEIQKAVANLNFADKLGNSATQKVRQKQLQKRLSDLQAQLAAAVAAGKKAC